MWKCLAHINHYFKTGSRFSEAIPSILRQNFDKKCKIFPCKVTKPVEKALNAGLEIS